MNQVDGASTFWSDYNVIKLAGAEGSGISSRQRANLGSFLYRQEFRPRRQFLLWLFLVLDYCADVKINSGFKLGSNENLCEWVSKDSFKIRTNNT